MIFSIRQIGKWGVEGLDKYAAAARGDNEFDQTMRKQSVNTRSLMHVKQINEERRKDQVFTDWIEWFAPSIAQPGIPCRDMNLFFHFLTDVSLSASNAVSFSYLLD